MSASLGITFIYERVVRGLSDDARLEVDALLGDPVAIAEQNTARRAAFDDAGFEIG